MYHAIVRARVNGLFAAANRGNWQAIIDGLSESFSYRFIGDTPLGGTRTTRKAMTAWFERLYRLFPGAQFAPQAIIVEGMPWNTRIMTYVKFQGTQPTESGIHVPYENEFMQLLTLKWGRITSVLTLEDTQRFERLLPVLHAAGIDDAAAAPISDELPGRNNL
jgi:ketosteroid isomerase-like protein